MSRIGKQPIEIPAKVEVEINGNTVRVKGPLGEMTRTFRPEIEITRDGNVITVTRKSDDRQSRSLHGLSRTLLNNMVVGVSTGFTKNLEMVGVGYRAAVQGKTLQLQLGYSHPIEVVPPAGIEITVDANTKITIKGFNKQDVGDLAAKIRAFRPPEPYKGKGVRYAGERVRRKAGKSGKK
jgi:large subunit ribosomal protein L6